MDNKTQSFQFRKTKLALAVAMTVGLAACGVDGDEGSTTTSNSNAQTDATQPVVTEKTGLTGTISGKVQDTNGRPVAGATVYFAGQETTTDAGGNYLFADVLVTNLQGNNDEGNNQNDDEIPSELTVTIAGPDGYIGAVVTVEPQAVVNNTGGSDGTNSSSSSTVTASTFVDGFHAEAGVAVIAEENSMITGYLRVGDSTPAEGEVVYLDFTGYNATTQATVPNTQTGTSFTLAANEYTATTDANGYFMFENVPADSTFVLGVQGKSITTADTDGSGVVATDGAINVATTLEQDENFIGTFQVVTNDFAVETRATYNPWVASVTGVLNPTVGVAGTAPDTNVYGDLNDGINKEVTINFSEALQVDVFEADKVRVAQYAGSYIATDSVTLSDDGTSLTIVFTEELAPGTKFTVFIPQASSIDADGEALNITRNVSNNPTNTPPYTDGSNTTIVYDELTAITGKAKYVEVNLCTFIDGNSGVSDATASQVFNESTTFDAGTVGLAGYSDAFQDAENSETNGDASASDIAQLNGQADTATKLKSLGDAVLNVIGDGETLDDVDVDFPWITVFTGTASTYAFNHITTATDDTTTAANTLFNASSSTAAFGADHGIDGSFDGEDIRVTFYDDFNVAAASADVELVDMLPPVTTLQENYNLYSVAGYSQILSTAGEADYGNGGEVANDGSSATAGNPIIWVQPRHLQQKGTNNAAPARTAVNTYAALPNLAARLDTNETSGLIDSNTEILGRPTYDRASYTAWAATSVSNEVGVDFSENVATTGTAPTTSGISTGLSGFVANNNVQTDVDGQDLSAVLGYDADLIQVTVSDVMNLANADNTGFVDFVGAVRDTSDAENVATAATNAKVIFRDAMPPLVTSAGWNGTELEMVFNEAVSITTATTVTLTQPLTGADVAVTLDPTVAFTSNTGFQQSADGRTVTVNVSGVAGISAVFVGDVTANDPTVDEFYYDDGGNSTADDQHAILRWDNINDANGNDWNTFTTGAADADGNGTTFTGYAARYQVEAPQFLAVNELGAFTVTPQNIIGLSANGALDADGNFVLTLDFTHPIDVDLIDGADNVLQETELAGLFYFDIDGNNTLDGDGVDNVAGNSDDEDILPAIDDVSISNNNQRITISIDRDNNAFTVTTAYIRMQGVVTSALIGTETIQQDFNIRN